MLWYLEERELFYHMVKKLDSITFIIQSIERKLNANKRVKTKNGYKYLIEARELFYHLVETLDSIGTNRIQTQLNANKMITLFLCISQESFQKVIIIGTY